MFNQVMRDYFVTGKETSNFIQEKNNIMSCHDIKSLEELKADIKTWYAAFIDNHCDMKGSFLSGDAMVFGVGTGLSVASAAPIFGWNVAKTTVYTLAATASCCFLGKTVDRTQKNIPAIDTATKMAPNVKVFLGIIEQKISELQQEQNTVIPNQVPNIRYRN
ncbi:MAG: hypothetical protein HKM04_06435 [Legionellales bacterium]|nr:hypothetical protein [Legionellales bacterium]